MSRSFEILRQLSISLAHFDQAPCAYKPSARSPPRFSPCRLAAAGSRSAALLGVLRQGPLAGGESSRVRLLTRRPAGVHPSRLSGGSGGGGASSLLFASCVDLLELIPAASGSARLSRSLGPVAESHRSSAEALAYSRGNAVRQQSRSASEVVLAFRRSLLC